MRKPRKYNEKIVNKISEIFNHSLFFEMNKFKCTEKWIFFKFRKFYESFIFIT